MKTIEIRGLKFQVVRAEMSAIETGGVYGYAVLLDPDGKRITMTGMWDSEYADLPEGEYPMWMNDVTQDGKKVQVDTNSDSSTIIYEKDGEAITTEDVAYAIRATVPFTQLT